MTVDVTHIRHKCDDFPSRRSAPWRDWQTIFIHRAAIASLLLVTVHQSIVASSTFFLTEAISKFESGRDYFADLSLYLIAMAAPYLPGCASFVMLQKWINQSHRALVDKFATTAASNRCNYCDHTTRENVTAVLSRNSFPVLRDYISFIHDLASFSLNSLLSIAVIVLLLPPRLAAGYCLSLALCFLIVIALQGSIAHASSRCEYAYLQYSGLLSGFWSNTVLGNEHNKAIWCRQRESSGKTFYAASNRLEVLRQCGNVLLAAASLGPTIFLIINITHENDVEPALIAALIVSLTRIFLIVNSLSTLVYRALDYISEHARIKVLLGALASLRGRSIAVPAEAINVMINGITVSDLSQAKRLIAPYERGRFTITGANGSGKSTLLIHLKKEYGASCFILPTNYSDLIWEKDYRSLSSGERLVAQLTEIFQIEEIHFLLLDEWDANLDKENVKQIDEILSSLSTTKVIIEVRHRRSEA